MLTAVLTGFIFACVLVFAGKPLKGRASLINAVVPIGLFVYFCAQIPQVIAEGAIYKSYSWVSSMGVDMNFNLDGLSMIFALMITGIGSMVFIYTSAYMKGSPQLDRFYGYLGMFMAAMLGVVLSDNLITIFVFWELTTIVSFFLIGYNTHDKGSRRAAMTSLGLTGLGGMLLLGGIILMGSIGDTYSIQEMLNSGIAFSDNAYYPLILFFIIGAAFTKSAQFPFHFWLPLAMKAPTPVSTYLHSATMVKAGIYLIFRLSPLLGNDPSWNNTLMLFGGITMLYGAWHTVFRTDLKAILAYSTISALGILTFLIGLGTKAAFLAALIFIMVHALYKATLFLVAGSIDKATGTRDILRLRGLGKYMIPVAIAGILAAISNAGIPPSFGFLGKDLIYEATLGMGESAVFLTAAAVLTNILLLYAGFVVGIKPFMGTRLDPEIKVKKLSPAIWVPGLILGILCIVFGIFPAVGEGLVRPALSAVYGEPFESHLKLWHGFTTILLLSGITIACGVLLYLFVKPSNQKVALMAKADFISPQVITEQISRGFLRLSIFWTRTFNSGYLGYYVITVMVFVIGIVGYELVAVLHVKVDFSQLKEVTFYEMSTILIMISGIVVAVFSQSRLAAIAALGVLGYAMCIIFVFYGAPDLAMTQFSIDTLTVILFVLIIFRLPKYKVLSNMRSRIRDGVVALSFGTLITLLILEVLAQPVNRELSEFYADNAYLLAKGKNVVNVILVDFRGIDTLVEITVLAIAAIGVFSLMKLEIKKSEID
ncbi:putative monovalent cation/H+ antiporter subunit A [Membranicola marinus]|uniref:Monovalent cation/H+ antiporter subunit A n=1 Tax=Membranihabitans marinus TaxID=1227546 RepID=A0A953HYS9_9BACT|nr:putative monovalent cation/H+ antiporter subunit A [Membranihabitans marinus]MBY5958202.1 putative monovalent cation/H+ antiporter subunit A [Membranihabitans marinus]